MNNKRTRFFVISATTQQPFIFTFEHHGSVVSVQRMTVPDLLLLVLLFLFHFIIHVRQTTT